jgi:hypothetical protein
MKSTIVLILSCVMLTAASAQQYGVKVTEAKNVDFTKLKSYSWTKWQPARLKAVDDQIVAAVDRQLKDLGMTKAASGPGDVQVSYASLTRTDVDLKSKPDASGSLEKLDVGTLVVRLHDPKNRSQLLELRLDKPFDASPSQLESTVNGAVAEMFAKYPTRPKK